MSFRTYSPQTLLEALAILRDASENQFPIAGGTNVLVDLRQGKICPKGLIDLSLIDEWRTIEQKGETLEIGSLVTHTELAVNPLVQKFFTALSKACQAVGSPQIRNRGTLGGNLQSASPAADCAPPLLAFEATLTLVSLTASNEVVERKVPIKDFFLGVGKTVLKPNELISKICLNIDPANRSIFFKSGLRKALSISLVNLAVNLTLDERGFCEKACIAFGSIAPTPVRLHQVEDFLKGQYLDEEIIKKATQMAQEEISPISDIRASAEYRRYLAEVLLHDALYSLKGSKEVTNG